jgi:hypothetical protein
MYVKSVTVQYGMYVCMYIEASLSAIFMTEHSKVYNLYGLWCGRDINTALLSYSLAGDLSHNIPRKP